MTRGDTLGVVSTGFAVKPAPLRAGVRRLERMGYRVLLGQHVLARNGYLAGGDEQRAGDLARMLRDPQVRGVWFARGGFGTARLLEQIPWAAYRRDPKPLIGYSDLTALFCAALRRPGPVCLYGPVVSELHRPELYHAPSLRNLLAGRPASMAFSQRDVLAEGRAVGRLMGGNLAVLTHLCGTRFMPDLENCVLFLEEVGEMTYSIDRMLTQLRLAGALRGLAGVLIGSFAVAPRRRFPPDRDLIELFRETFASLGIPVVRGLVAGHVRGKRTLPLGARTELDTERRRIRFTP